MVKNLPANTEAIRFNPWFRKIPWRRKWQPNTAVFHGQRSPPGCNQWGRKESNMTKHTHTHTHTQDLRADADSINSLMLLKTGYRTVYSLYECLSKGYTPIDTSFKRFPDSSDGRVYPQCWRPGFDSSVGKNPWRRKWQPIPIFLPGKSHGWRSLVG